MTSRIGKRLHSFINNYPVHERDLFFMARLKPLSLSDATEELRSGASIATCLLLAHRYILYLDP